MPIGQHSFSMWKMPCCYYQWYWWCGQVDAVLSTEKVVPMTPRKIVVTSEETENGRREGWQPLLSCWGWDVYCPAYLKFAVQRQQRQRTEELPTSGQTEAEAGLEPQCLGPTWVQHLLRASHHAIIPTDCLKLSKETVGAVELGHRPGSDQRRLGRLEE